MPIPELHTRRLVLRAWRDEDREPFAAMNRDPRVFEHLPGPLTRAECDAAIDRAQASLEKNGYGKWAVEAPGVAPFVGFVGLDAPTFEAPFMPCVEIAWRLASDFWGRGYASEAARAVLTHGFLSVGLREILSFTVPANVRSQQVMTAIGLERSAREDFEHPRLPPGHRLRAHVLFRLTRERWEAQTAYASPAPSALDRARAFASALDADDFERARPLLAARCEYHVRGEAHEGPNAILASYANATRRARSLFEEVRYESAVESLDPARARVVFVDVLRRGSRAHRHTSRQTLTFDSTGRITAIDHEDLPGEAEALHSFLAS